MNVQEIKSDMEMKNLYFSSIVFKRGKDITTGEIQIDISPRYEKEADINRVILQTKISKKNEIDLTVETIGEFVFSSNMPDADIQNTLLKANAIAMMLPYVRAIVTQITAQPNMMPIVLPMINTLKIIDDEQR